MQLPGWRQNGTGAARLEGLPDLGSWVGLAVGGSCARDGAGLRVRSASWVTSTSSVPAPSEAVRGTGRLCAVRCCGVSS
jgi:hypothetical protein